jgi:hypothetical protein
MNTITISWENPLRWLDGVFINMEVDGDKGEVILTGFADKLAEYMLDLAYNNVHLEEFIAMAEFVRRDDISETVQSYIEDGILDGITNEDDLFGYVGDMLEENIIYPKSLEEKML